MSKIGDTEKTSDLALDGLMRLLIQQGSQTNEQMGLLTESVQTLVKTSIESESRHKQNDERNERIESNQKKLGEKVEALSDAIISMSKDLERNADRWAALYKILSGIMTTIIGAALVAAYVTNK